MNAISFDTLLYAKKLKEAGFTEKQAEAQVEAQKEILSEVLDTSLATKEDIHGLKDDIYRLDKQIAVLKWMMGVMLTGVLALILKTFFI